jgi:dolichol-phosphate mannosyltransferase
MTKQLSLTVILPTYNERDNVPILIEGILRHVQTPVKVLVVDDNSPDATWRVAEEIACHEPRVRLLRRMTERGLTSAIWAGIQAADTDAVVWMDCDLAMPPETIPHLLDRLEAGADIAVGSRYVKGGSDPGHSFMARAFSVTINLCASLLLGFGVRDYTSGFVAARRAVFDLSAGRRDVPVESSGPGKIVLAGDYGEYCISLLARAQRLGFRVAEVPYICAARFSGESKTGASVADYLRRGWKYVVTILRLAAGR